MNRDELRGRTKKFAVDIILFIGNFPKTVAGYVIAKQLIKCGTSVGANYRAACRGRSKAEFNSKLHIVLEEADESLFWLETIMESKLLENDMLDYLLVEAHELTSIFASSYKTAKKC
jgi:four helix bundle protein